MRGSSSSGRGRGGGVGGSSSSWRRGGSGSDDGQDARPCSSHHHQPQQRDDDDGGGDTGGWGRSSTSYRGDDAFRSSFSSSSSSYSQREGRGRSGGDGGQQYRTSGRESYRHDSSRGGGGGGGGTGGWDAGGGGGRRGGGGGGGRGGRGREGRDSGGNDFRDWRRPAAPSSSSSSSMSTGYSPKEREERRHIPAGGLTASTHLHRGKELVLDDIEVGTAVYQALIYASHDVHGFFLHFGKLDDAKGTFHSFPSQGRITRTGLPATLLAQCEQRASEANKKGGSGILRSDLLLSVKVKSFERPPMGKPKIELMLVPDKKKKLLILDLNGVLFNRYPVGDGRRIRKEIQKRPGCDEFLDFCFGNFEVGAWSCCRKETLELDVFGTHQKDLLFVNHSVHSTSLWPRHSVVSPNKPLFLKQLTRLWSQFDRVDYNATNTILLDNHVEKFEGNPLGTCLVVPEYEDGVEPVDNVLALEGELVRRLASMAAAEDSSLYVRSTPVGECPFFPTSHPEPPCDVGAVLKKALLDVFCASEVMKQHHPLLTVSHYLSASETPGPRAIQIRRKTLKEVVNKKHLPHLVCEKSDGTRLFLFLPPTNVQEEIRKGGGGESEGYFFDRHWQPEALDVDDAKLLAQRLSPRGGVTLLDGELIQPLPTEGQEEEEHGQEKQHYFLIFDVIFLDGEDVGAEPLLQTRMHKLREALAGGASSSNSSSYFIVRFGPTRPAEKVQLLSKVFYKMEELPEMVDKMMSPTATPADEEFVFDDGHRRSLSDGLVFTPSSLPYYLYQVYKYKTPGRISVDFKVKLADLRQVKPGALTAPLYLLVAKHDTKFTDLDLRQGDALQRLREHLEVNVVGECVVECDLSHVEGLWVLRNIRTDKKNPNSLQTAWNNLEAIGEGLDMDTLVKELERLCALTTNEEDGGEGEEGGAAVASHYDVLQEKRWAAAAGASTEEVLDPRIHNLRRLNNWIKTVLIEACAKGELQSFQVGGQEEEEEQEILGDLPNPLATPEEHKAAAAARGNSSATKVKQQRHEEKEGFRVLDLACGRGGDLKKWVLQGAEVYVGVDVSSQSVAECQSRAEEAQRRRGKPRVAVILTKSMLDQDLPEVIEKALMRQTQGANGDGDGDSLFDIISIQFAIHYAFASEASLLQLLHNISRLLVPWTGQLIVTSVDARCLAHHLRARQEGEFGNAVYNVKFSSEAMAKIRKEEEGMALDALGLRYTFTLSSAVEACDEYVVHLPSLTQLAREEAGLEMIYHRNFGEFVKDQLPHYGHLLEPLQVGQVSPEEWEAVQLYSAIIFQRNG